MDCFCPFSAIGLTAVIKENDASKNNYRNIFFPKIASRFVLQPLEPRAHLSILPRQQDPFSKACHRFTMRRQDQGYRDNESAIRILTEKIVWRPHLRQRQLNVRHALKVVPSHTCGMMIWWMVDFEFATSDLKSMNEAACAVQQMREIIRCGWEMYKGTCTCSWGLRADFAQWLLTTRYCDLTSGHLDSSPLFRLERRKGRREMRWFPDQTESYVVLLTTPAH